MTDSTYDADTISEFLSTWLADRPLSPINQKLVDDYYANFRGLRSARMRFWYENQVREVEELIRGLDGPRVLEIGVGTGTETLWFAMLGADVTGIDVFPHCTSAATERLGVLQRKVDRPLRCRIETVSLLDFEDDNGFDIIWMEQAFHHLEPREQVVGKIAELLRPGGYVALSEANALNPLLQLQPFRARGFKTIIETSTASGAELYGNERVLSASRLGKELASAGILTERVRYFRIFPSHPIFDFMSGVEQALARMRIPPCSATTISSIEKPRSMRFDSRSSTANETKIVVPACKGQITSREHPQVIPSLLRLRRAHPLPDTTRGSSGVRGALQMEHEKQFSARSVFFAV